MVIAISDTPLGQQFGVFLELSLLGPCVPVRVMVEACQNEFFMFAWLQSVSEMFIVLCKVAYNVFTVTLE